MHLYTCSGCAVKPNCEKAASLRALLKGSGVTSLKHRCGERRPVYAPGQAVIFTTFVTFDGDAYAVKYPGYIVEQIGSRVLGFITPGSPDVTQGWPFETSGTGYVKMPLARVEPDATRSEADASICTWCGNHPGLGAPCNRDPEHTPDDKCRALTTTGGDRG